MNIHVIARRTGTVRRGNLLVLFADNKGTEIYRLYREIATSLRSSQ